MTQELIDELIAKLKVIKKQSDNILVIHPDKGSPDHEDLNPNTLLQKNNFFTWLDLDTKPSYRTAVKEFDEGLTNGFDPYLIFSYDKAFQSINLAKKGNKMRVILEKNPLLAEYLIKNLDKVFTATSEFNNLANISINKLFNEILNIEADITSIQRLLNIINEEISAADDKQKDAISSQSTEARLAMDLKITARKELLEFFDEIKCEIDYDLFLVAHETDSSPTSKEYLLVEKQIEESRVDHTKLNSAENTDDLDTYINTNHNGSFEAYAFALEMIGEGNKEIE